MVMVVVAAVEEQERNNICPTLLGGWKGRQSERKAGWQEMSGGSSEGPRKEWVGEETGRDRQTRQTDTKEQKTSERSTLQHFPGRVRDEERWCTNGKGMAGVGGSVYRERIGVRERCEM